MSVNVKKMKKIPTIDDLAFVRRVVSDIINSDSYNRCKKLENILKVNMEVMGKKVYSKVLLTL